MGRAQEGCGGGWMGEWDEGGEGGGELEGWAGSSA